MHFYIVPDGQDCREKGQALRKEDERERDEAVSRWYCIFTVSQTGGIVEKTDRPWEKRTDKSKVEQLEADR